MSPTLSTHQRQEAAARCRQQRRRILEVSQKVDALHVAPAFSCLELVDAVLNYCVDKPVGGADGFILSKGHGAMAHYVVLESLGVLDPARVNRISQSGSTVGGHPDRGIPGIIASTGSLGHGLPLALGIARGQREHATPGRVFVVMSDGELMEGSVWEALLLGPSLGITNVTVIIDHNGSISRGDIMKVQPNLLPVAPKLQAFGWDTREVHGHDSAAIVEALRSGTGSAPLAIIARTTKGKGVSYMENQPIWAYRSPSPDEYQLALSELVDPEDSHA
ncbi:MAG: transketolase [Actinomycetota bacterium]|nr:transketolase [Actinomycetota bacterium]